MLSLPCLSSVNMELRGVLSQASSHAHLGCKAQSCCCFDFIPLSPVCFGIGNCRGSLGRELSRLLFPCVAMLLLGLVLRVSPFFQ